MLTETLKSKGWYKPPFRSFYTHVDSPDSRITVAGRNWKHTAWGGITMGNTVTVGTGSTIKGLRKHLGYFHRMLDNASGS